VKAAPGLKNEVWVSLGTDGLFRSSDGGQSFKPLSNIKYSYLFGFGKNPPDKNFPAVFFMGQTTDGQTGIFRSDDFGISWLRINDSEHQFGNEPHCMEGDRQVFGRVYIGTGGSGIFYGEKQH